MSEAYAGKQFVGMDVHRRRSVVLRMIEAGEWLETVRISNDPEYLRAVMARAGSSSAPATTASAPSTPSTTPSPPTPDSPGPNGVTSQSTREWTPENRHFQIAGVLLDGQPAQPPMGH